MDCVEGKQFAANALGGGGKHSSCSPHLDQSENTTSQ